VSLGLYNPPDGVWQYVFLPSHNLTRLTSFTFASRELVHHEDIEDFVPPLPWCYPELTSLVSCCPSLCSIDGIWVEHGLDVSVLGKLTSLTNLCVKFDVADQDNIDESLEGLAGLRGLLSLRLTILEDWDEPVGLLPATFLPLTSLYELTFLEYSCSTGEMHCYPEFQEFSLISSVSLAPATVQVPAPSCVLSVPCYHQHQCLGEQCAQHISTEL
jgi:hypothetical protein